MQHLKHSRQRWLWMVLGLWLTLFQTTVAAHSIEEGIVAHQHGDCLLCHAGHLTGATAHHIPALHVVASRTLTVSAPLPPVPLLLLARQHHARAPPFC
ncbi:hypothetical protein HR45_05640 [Shewanella mangrovi]|uniref:Uncharacterized protein n=1 Tax=Shewanella mangrovi TaxID=1515746 RepID=A0A094JIW4_9GAMM|nr:hypothetical protein [Shewanella mangrovi]KFZ37994.1 hypothetical protein HR45_05640 [Shewanella mangrovi]